MGTLTGTSLTGMGMGPAGIVYSGLGTLQVALGVLSNNQFNIQSTATATATTVGIATGVSPVFGTDAIYVGSRASNTPVSGGILDMIQGPLTVNGAGAGQTNLYIDDTGSTAVKSGLLTSASLTGLGMGAAGIAYSGIAALNIALGSGGDTMNVRSTAAGTITTIDPSGVNTFNVGSNAPSLVGGTLSGIAGLLQIIGSGGDTLNLDNSGDPTAGQSGTLTSSTLFGLGMGLPGLYYQGVSMLNLGLGTGGTTLAVIVSPALDLPAVTTIDGGPSSSDHLAATFLGSLNGLLNLLDFEYATVSVAGNFNGTLHDSAPGGTGNIQKLTVGGSLTQPALLTADNIAVMTVGQNLAGQVIVAGALTALAVGGGTPGTIQAGKVGTIAVAAGFGPLVAQINEAGIQRRVEAAVPGQDYPTPPPPPSPTPAVSPSGVTFQFFYEGLASPLNLVNPQLTARVTNTGPVTDQFDFSLITYNDTAKFNLARLDAAGVSGIRNVAVEGDILTAVTTAALAFIANDQSPAGIDLPADQLAGVGVRDYAPAGSIAAGSIQAVAFGSTTRNKNQLETGAAANGNDAAALLTSATAIVPAGSTNGSTTETFRVPFADLASQQVGFFMDDNPGGGNGHFDNNNVVLVVQAVSTANPNGTANVPTPQQRRPRCRDRLDHGRRDLRPERSPAELRRREHRAAGRWRVDPDPADDRQHEQ